MSFGGWQSTTRGLVGGRVGKERASAVQKEFGEGLKEAGVHRAHRAQAALWRDEGNVPGQGPAGAKALRLVFLGQRGGLASGVASW